MRTLKPYKHSNVYAVFVKCLFTLALTCGAGALYAQSTLNAEQFYKRALKLEKLGVRAPFNADFKPITNQARKSFKTLESQNKRAKQRGRPLYCKNEDQNMPPREVLRQLGRIPRATRQKINITRAFLIIAKRKYPC